MTAISVEGLSKRYQLGAAAASEETLLAQLVRLGRAGLRFARPRMGESHWALRNVSFDVKDGEVIGVIGANGAGKSTLLKILSRVTEPTAGRAIVRGRMASLLEVGTGFHPDLTGRDNVRMNAAILGMSRQDIQRRFDEIVAFAGIERFIDTPIKHYSSGMKMRLAFAVAAHLDPDILLIDEVLAVGDAAFQKKCLNRIEEVSAHGRTILFVSHHLTTVARLCSRTLVLDQGQVAFNGPTLEAIRCYNDRSGVARSRREWPAEQAPGDDVARLREVEILDGPAPAAGPIDVRHEIGIRLRYEIQVDGHAITPAVHLFDAGGNWIFAALDLDPQWHGKSRPAGQYESLAWIPPNLLNEGPFVVSATLATLEPFRQHLLAHDCAGFTVFDPAQGDTARGAYRGEIPGFVRPILRWSTRRV